MGVRRAGLTLVEVLVAAAVAALLAVGFYESMIASKRRFEGGQSGLEASKELQRILELLRHDMERPPVWTPCNYPEEVLREFGYAGDRVAFALESRAVARWFTYYAENEGPTREPTFHIAAPKRKRAPLAPCRVVWSDCRDGYARWRTPPAAPTLKELSCLKSAPPWVEYVPSKGSTPVNIWMIGPAIWHLDEEAGMVRRFTPERGIVDLGAGRVESFALVPTEEWSVNEIFRPVHTHVPGLVKRMLDLHVSLRRDADRPPLTVETLLAHHTRDFLPPPAAPPMGAAPMAVATTP